MKLVIAVIQPTKLNAVREALQKIEVTRLTVCDAQGFARQRGRTEMYRGHEYTTRLLRKVALEIVVNDDFLDRTLETLINTARTGPEGTIGDGKIFVLPADQAIQINDGSRGPFPRVIAACLCANCSSGVRGRCWRSASSRIRSLLASKNTCSKSVVGPSC